MGRKVKDEDSLVLVEDSVQRTPSHALEADGTASAPNLRKSDSTPAPGQYVWHDDVHLRKKPVWSMTSPDRKNLDLMPLSCWGFQGNVQLFHRVSRFHNYMDKYWWLMTLLT